MFKEMPCARRKMKKIQLHYNTTAFNMLSYVTGKKQETFLLTVTYIKTNK